eukprot:3985324-Alexandrium_andersonii.AAC.1
MAADYKVPWHGMHLAYLARCTLVLSTQNLIMNKRHAQCNCWYVQCSSRNLLTAAGRSVHALLLSQSPPS